MTLHIRKLGSTDADFNAQLRTVLAFETVEDEAIDRTAAGILADVKARGDVAVLEYTKRFDRFEATSVSALEIHQDELHLALASLPAVRRDLLQTAADRVRSYHERQKQECGSQGFLYDGKTCDHRIALSTVDVDRPRMLIKVWSLAATKDWVAHLNAILNHS